MLGGFHFNDRRYADDDLTLGSIDPYQVFRIFHEIRMFEWETGKRADIAYMIDQSHNLKRKIEAMIQTVATAQEIVCQGGAGRSRERWRRARRDCELVDAEECLKDAFSTRRAAGDPRMAAVARGCRKIRWPRSAQSGYLERITAERAEKNRATVSSYA